MTKQSAPISLDELICMMNAEQKTLYDTLWQQSIYPDETRPSSEQIRTLFIQILSDNGIKETEQQDGLLYGQFQQKLRKQILQKPDKSQIQQTVEAIPLDSICYPLASVVRLYRSEKVKYVKIHRLLDSFEVLLKYLVSYLLFQARQKEPEPNQPSLQGLFSDSIMRPALGHWVGYLRFLLAPSKELPHWEYLNEEYFKDLAKAYQSCQRELDGFVTLRNYYGHGAVANTAQCEADLHKYEPQFNKLMKYFQTVLELPLYSRNANNASLLLWQGAEGVLEKEIPVGDEWTDLVPPFIIENTRGVSLFPLMYIPEESLHCFYNSMRDLKKNRIEFLSYDTGMHYEERKNVAPEFIIHFPPHEHTLGDSSALRREEYLANFVGRDEELQQILEYLATHESGYFMLWGSPGVGKGALISRLVAELMVKDYNNLDIELSEGMARLGNAAIVPYLLEQNDNDPTAMLRALISQIARQLGVRREIGIELVKLREVLKELLAEASKREVAVILIVDGLDEPLRTNADNSAFLNSLPNHMPEGCYVVLSSRPVPEIQNYWQTVYREMHADMNLEGVKTEDIREMLCSEMNKYEVFQQQDFVESLYDASIGASNDQTRGNPLYIKLALNDLRDGLLSMDNPGGIPKGIYEMYEGFLKRTTGQGLSVLYAIAAALSPISPYQIGLVQSRKIDTIQRDTAAIQEMLQENQLTPDIEDYSIFHKSLTDFLNRERYDDVIEQGGLLLNYCRRWSELAADYHKAATASSQVLSVKKYAATYAFRHLCDHLLDAINMAGEVKKMILLNELILTIDSANFREQMFDYCGTLAPLQRGIVGAQELLMSKGNIEENAATVLRFALYYADEQERFLREANERLTDVAESGDWIQALNLVGMSATERERVFQAMRLIRALPGDVRVHAQDEIDRQVKDWLRFEDDPKLVECWEEVVGII